MLQVQQGPTTGIQKTAGKQVPQKYYYDPTPEDLAEAYAQSPINIPPRQEGFKNKGSQSLAPSAKPESADVPYPWVYVNTTADGIELYRNRETGEMQGVKPAEPAIKKRKE
jgi:hypothetical protein